MENEELFIGKTIESVMYDSSDYEDKIILIFTDGTSASITTNGSNQMYFLYIEKINES